MACFEGCTFPGQGFRVPGLCRQMTVGFSSQPHTAPHFQTRVWLWVQPRSTAGGGIKDGVGKCTGSQRLGLSLPGAVLERKLAKPQEGRLVLQGPQSSGYWAAAGRRRKDDAGARRKRGRRSHKLRHPRLKEKPKGSPSLVLTSTSSLVVAKTGQSSLNLSW